MLLLDTLLSVYPILRLIQTFNATSYVRCNGHDTEDGFCPIFNGNSGT